jgi:hypothetical protein
MLRVASAARVVVLALSVVLLGLRPAAQAQTHAESLEEARELFTDGSAMARDERWGEAYELFLRSWEIVERPGTAFNLAAVLIRLGRALEALRFVEAFLAFPGTETSADDRERARALAREAEAQVVVLSLRIAPASARIEVDGSLPCTTTERTPGASAASGSTLGRIA